MLLRTILSSCGIASVLVLAGCASDSRDDDVADPGAIQPLSVQQDFPIAFKKEFVKTISFSKDYGSGDASFAATAIVTAKASIDVDTKLSLQAATRWGKLDSFNGDLSGKWNVNGIIDIRVQLTGKAAKNADFVRTFARQTDHLLQGSETLYMFPLPTGLSLGPAKLNAGIEVALACEADAEVNLEAQATTGVNGNLAYDLSWNRNVPRGKVNEQDNHWSASSKGTTINFQPPTFAVTEGSAEIHARCGLRPSVNLEVELGAGDFLSADVGAKLVGEAYATADGKIDAVNHKWSVDYDLGVEGSLDLYAGASVLGFAKTIDKSIPLFGGPGNPLHLGQRHLDGQLPVIPLSYTVPVP
jgi:hypothetical protein